MNDFRNNANGTEQTAKPPAKQQERRAARRTCLHLKADVTLPGDLTIVGHTLDISTGGLSIEVPYCLEVGQHCVIELNLAKLGGPKSVQLTGEVRRCVAVDDTRFQVGLQFVELDPALIELVDKYIWSRLAS